VLLNEKSPCIEHGLLFEVWELTSDPELGKFAESGRILADVREFVRGMHIQNRRVLEVCEEVEGKIGSLGGRPAFPCNVGINETAAHYTSPYNDPTLIPSGSLVKIDFGVELDGFITDTAVTLSLNPVYDSMIVAAETALHEALTAVAPGRKLSEIGTVVEQCIQRYGFRPIRNLTGHKIARYTIHAGKSVPNISGMESGRFEVGEVYALEPFVTTRDAEGAVRDGDAAYIYRFVKEKGAKSEEAVKLAEHICDTYRTLPFASRWIFRDWQESGAEAAFAELVAKRCVVGYPVLVEASGKVVSQAEHTIVITDDGCRVLTE
jgi:methionyl aminopeptidase